MCETIFFLLFILNLYLFILLFILNQFVIDKYGMLILYHSLFLPYIIYSIEVWGNTYATNLNCLVLLQKRLCV